MQGSDRDASKFDERMFMKWLKEQINLDDEKNIKIHSNCDNFSPNDYEQIEKLRKGSDDLIEMEVDETEDLSPMSSVREKNKKQPFNVNIMNLLKDLNGSTSEQNEKMLKRKPSKMKQIEESHWNHYHNHLTDLLERKFNILKEQSIILANILNFWPTIGFNLSQIVEEFQEEVMCKRVCVKEKYDLFGAKLWKKLDMERNRLHNKISLSWSINCLLTFIEFNINIKFNHS